MNSINKSKANKFKKHNLNFINQDFDKFDCDKNIDNYAILNPLLKSSNDLNGANMHNGIISYGVIVYVSGILLNKTIYTGSSHNKTAIVKWIDRVIKCYYSNTKCNNRVIKCHYSNTKCNELLSFIVFKTMHANPSSLNYKRIINLAKNNTCCQTSIFKVSLFKDGLGFRKKNSSKLFISQMIGSSKMFTKLYRYQLKFSKMTKNQLITHILFNNIKSRTTFISRTNLLQNAMKFHIQKELNNQ
jgi:hypothetical protein